jgi:PAS domain S-box-containing protein
MSAAPKTTGSPLAPFMYCAAITVVLLVAGGLVFAGRYREMLAIETSAVRLTHLDGVILRLDDLQTMSAEMAAATGDPRWAKLHHENDAPLDSAINEALSLVPATASQFERDAEVAGAAVDVVEDRAIELSLEGRLAEATAMFDAAYDDQKQRYANAMSSAMDAISVAAHQRLEEHRRTMLTATLLAAAAVAFMALLWLRMLSLIRRYIRERGEAEAQLVAEHGLLETRVAERTQDLGASREQYRALVENIDAIPFEWDPGTFRLRYVAPQAARLLECPLDALRDEALFNKALHEDDRARLRDRIDRFVAGENPCTIDFRMLTHTGRTVTIRMFLAGREPSQTSRGVMMDITKQVRLEAELQQSQKLESVGRLAAGVAHEINTPVQFVTDSVQFIRESVADVTPMVDKLRQLAHETLAGGPCLELARQAVAAEGAMDMAYLSSHVPRALDLALDGLARIATIVRSMKVFAHPDHKDKVLVDLNESIDSTLTIAHAEYKYVAELVKDFGQLPGVSCYAGDLNQVVLNLVVNAAHAIGDAIAKTDRRGRITVTTRRDGDHVVIAIADTGMGIPASIQECVFDPFFTTKEVGKGTGQGLSLARSVIVDKHHGSLTFDTTPGVGTTFYIRIPIDSGVPAPLGSDVAVIVEPKAQRIAAGGWHAESIDLAPALGLLDGGARARRRTDLLIEMLAGMPAGESPGAAGEVEPTKAASTSTLSVMPLAPSPTPDSDIAIRPSTRRSTP